MTTITRDDARGMVSKIELREFPADVQDLLRNRAIELEVSIEEVMAGYLVEKSGLIVEAVKLAS